MIIYPAIDLKDGECVRLQQGDMDRVTVFNQDPTSQARAFEAAGEGDVIVCCAATALTLVALAPRFAPYLIVYDEAQSELERAQDDGPSSSRVRRYAAARTRRPVVMPQPELEGRGSAVMPPPGNKVTVTGPRSSYEL